MMMIIVAAVLFISNNNQTGYVTSRQFLTKSDFLYDYEIIRYPTEALIVKPTQQSVRIGLVTDSWNLKFGIIPGNGSIATRIINLTNNRDNDARISFNVRGNITPFIEFDESDFILHNDEIKSIRVHFKTADSKPGNFTGEIDVIIRRPRFKFVGV